MNLRTLASIAALTTSVLGASVAYADDASQAALAEKLFRDGRTLLSEGKLREACESFGESKRLDASPGTLLNLAKCLEELGRTASAWAAYRELETRATRLGQDARASFARQKVGELERRLATLEIRITPAHRIPGLTVECDDAVLGAAAVSGRVPIDPGPHKLIVRAPGREPWSTTVQAAASAATVIDVPLLAPDAAQPEVTPTTSAKAASSPLRGIGIVLAVVGGVATVTGLGFGVGAKITDDGARRDACIDTGCTADGLARIHRADDLATVSTVVTIGGLSVAAVGVVLWLLAPVRADSGPRASSLGLPQLAGGTF
ncbi:MAG: hypothetical protein JWP87_3753 [Labilithrix sp.]|nr:hypothetical protein [Labilithrix sp.]